MHKSSQKLAVSALGFLFTVTAAAATPAQNILNKARQNLDSKGDQAHVTLKIIEPGGEVKTREMTLQVLRTKNGFKSMIRMTAPADVKDTALLAEVENGDNREYLYLPSTKQVRRITSTKKSSGILGSELSAEDLDPIALKSSSLKMVKETPKMAVIALFPKKGTSEYTKVLTSFALPQSLPEKTEYFKGAKLVKTVDYQSYKSFPGGIFRAQKIHIMNVLKKRGTDIEFSEMKVNPPLVAKDFTPDALKENW